MKQQLRAQREKRGDVSTSSVETDTAAPASAAAPAASGDLVGAAALYALGAAYWFVLLLSPRLAGPPRRARVGGRARHPRRGDCGSRPISSSCSRSSTSSVNLLGAAPAVHPVTLGVFNFAEAFIFMLLPPLLMDRRGRDLPTVKVWSVAMFLTNAAMLPFMAKRTATPVPESWEADKASATDGPAELTGGEKGLLSRAFGASGLAVGLLSVWWAAAADPAVGGDLTQRTAFLGELMTSDRVSLAFVVDIAFFSAWQAYLIGELDEQRRRRASTCRSGVSPRGCCCEGEQGEVANGTKDVQGGVKTTREKARWLVRRHNDARRVARRDDRRP